MNIAIVGSRDFNNYDDLCEVLYSTVNASEDTIISGGAKGADKLGERFADENNVPKKVFLPDWDKYGKGAGFIRNSQIVEEADYVIAFWDGKSKGTADTVKKAEKKGIEILKIMY